MKLEDRIVPNPRERWAEELRGVFDEGRTHPLLTNRTAEIGLLLINRHPHVRTPRDTWRPIPFPVPSPSMSPFKKLFEMIPAEGFRETEFLNLLVYFFGEEIAGYAAHAWDHAANGIFQTDEFRRSFRAPRNREIHFGNQLAFLISSLAQFYTARYNLNIEFTFYNLSLEEQVRFDNFGSYLRSLSQLWAAALDCGNASLFQLFEDIVFGRDPFGKVSHGVIRALLFANDPKCWNLVEKLLLAAQRQEGLRQTILEAMDETSVGALKHFVGVILDNKLTRFSSVVRGLDVWIGIGWEAEREPAVRSFLEKARGFLNDPDAIPEAAKSRDNATVYMALWAQGVFDVVGTVPYLRDLLETGDREKRLLALYFALQVRRRDLTEELFLRALDESDPAAIALALQGIQSFIPYGETMKNVPPQLFAKLTSIAERFGKKPQTFEGILFSSLKITFDRNAAFAVMIGLIGSDKDRLHHVLSYYEELNVGLRQHLARELLGEFTPNFGQPPTTKQPTDFQRQFAFRILPDRSELIAEMACRALLNVSFTREELQLIEDLLKRKSAGFRGNLIQLVLRQSDSQVSLILPSLLESADGEQRLAGLDVALQLKKARRLAKQVSELRAQFESRRSISTNERVLLDQLSDSDGDANECDYEHGYGLWNPARAFSPRVAPTTDPEGFFERHCIDTRSFISKTIDKLRISKSNTEKVQEFGFSMPLADIVSRVSDLAAELKKYSDFEYEVETWNGSKEKVLLGNSFRTRRQNVKYESEREHFEDYPLPEVWEKWLTESGLKPIDVFILKMSLSGTESPLLPDRNRIVPPEHRTEYYYNDPILHAITALRLICPFPEEDDYLLGACERLFSSLDPATLNSSSVSMRGYMMNRGWQDDGRLHTHFSRIEPANLSDENIARFWKLANWRQFSGRAEYVLHAIPKLETFARAFECGLISEDELLRGMMTEDNLRTISLTGKYAWANAPLTRFPFLQPLYEKIREHLLDIELKRGDTETPVTFLTASIRKIFGVRRFVSLLKGLGKTPLQRGYSYFGAGHTKRDLFSALVKCCHPLESDTQELFDELISDAGISDVKLIEAAVYAPQWQRFVSRHLGWKGLDSAVWWMHAHTRISGYHETNAEAESEIARHSDVDLEDFKNGAVDKEWFLRAYKEIGKSRWEIVYDAAKYISEGNGHRRARLYADVILGNTKIKEITEKIVAKRDQDYLRIYGLVPLSRSNPEKDVLARYNFLQKFKKESRQFGSQKQTSETLAVQIAMENLARNAGYADPLRLSWAMETKQVRELLESAPKIDEREFEIELGFDEDGKAEFIVRKSGKPLKSVPAAFKKDRRYAELAEARKILREQFSRSRKSLESAMVRGDAFTIAELENLFTHPVISKHLEKLVFASRGGTGFYESGALVAPSGEAIRPEKDDEIRIAHCVDLNGSGNWSEYQRHCFERRMKQPFKQIFRELYLPTTDESQSETISRRYAGHQIQPKQTAALLKSRGWRIDHDFGLQKVFHDAGFAATMYAMCDWFSPADVECPTIESVQFEDLKDRSNRKFADIEPRIFSEVMRDLDLVVSVAHAGGVDAEASHSSIEMRAALLRETLRLFKIENVSIAGSHATIEGTIGRYSVHLGSAVVHKMPGGYVSILPVHSQHRGRIFLPFADDDPRTAEIISKVLLLARDKEIQDPTILQQLY